MVQFLGSVFYSCRQYNSTALAKMHVHIVLCPKMNAIAATVGAYFRASKVAFSPSWLLNYDCWHCYYINYSIRY